MPISKMVESKPHLRNTFFDDPSFCDVLQNDRVKGRIKDRKNERMKERKKKERKTDRKKTERKKIMDCVGLDNCQMFTLRLRVLIILFA